MVRKGRSVGGASATRGGVCGKGVRVMVTAKHTARNKAIYVQNFAV